MIVPRAARTRSARTINPMNSRFFMSMILSHRTRAVVTVLVPRGAACRRKLDLPLGLLDPFDDDLDRVAEPVATAAPPAGHGRAELVQLEIVAGKPPCRQVALEDLPEADEQAGADQTDDLALVGLLPAALEELRVEEPGEAELVRQVLDLRRLSLAAGRVLGQFVELHGRRLVGEAELAQQRSVDDQIRVAPDRRREMAIGAAGEPRVAEILGVVAGLLERAEHERGEGLAAPARAECVVHNALARLRGDRCGRRRSEEIGGRRRRDLEIRELLEQQLDRLRIRALVDAIQRLAAPRREQPGNGLVRGDHQLLDEAVRGGLGFLPRARDSAVAVEVERDLGALDPERAACEPPVANRRRQTIGELERGGDVGLGLPPLGLRVRQACPAANDRAVEAWLPVRWQLDRHAQTVLVGPKAAAVVGELGRKHRRGESRDVRREGAGGGAPVEGRARGNIGRDVRDVHQGAKATVLLLHGERVVEVLRGLGIDREREELAQVDAVGEILRGRRVGLELGARAGVDEQPFEDGFDVVRLSEHTFEPRAPTAGADDGEISGACVTEALAVEDEGDVRNEERLADDELPALPDLDDDEVVRHYTCRKRRMVKPEPAAPSRRPVPIRINALREKESAATSEPACSGPVWSRVGSATSFPTIINTIAPKAPAIPHRTPSSMNGPRTNQFVAPTSFITSISRRRAKIDKRMVLAISKVEAPSSRMTAMMKTISIRCASLSTRWVVFFP